MTWKERFYSGLVGVISVGLLWVGTEIKGCNKEKEAALANKVQEDKSVVYKGDVDGRNVVYQENFDFNLDGKTKKANVMIVRNGRETYTLIDHENFRGIDWKLENAPKCDGDSLERVLIDKDGSSYTFNRDDVSDATLDGKKAKIMLDKGTEYFNNNRTKIRDKKRVEYGDSLKSVEDFFGN